MEYVHARLVLAALVLTWMAVPAGPSAIGQTLDLANAISPPELQQPTYAAHLVSELDGELQQFRNPPGEEDQPHRAIRSACINVRLIAADLLATGDRAGKDGSILILAGMRLAGGRAAIEGSLKKVLEATPAIQPDQTSNGEEDTRIASQRESILHWIQSFNESAEALERQAHPFDGQNPDELLQATFKHLAHAIAALEQTPLASHWVTARAVKFTGATPPIAQATSDDRPELSLEEIAARLPVAAIPQQSRDDLSEIVDFLRRGEQFPELQPRIDQYRDIVQATLELADAVAQAEWLTEDERQRYSRRIADAVGLFKAPATRGIGLNKFQRLNRSRALIDQVGSLAQQKIEVKPIAGALSAAEAMIDDDSKAEDGRRQLMLLGPILERMVAYRRLAVVNFKGELRIVERDLHKSYRKAEDALLKQIGAMTANSHPMADPAFTTLLSDQRQLLADLQRLRMAPAWMQTIATIDHASSELFERQILKLSRGLLDSNRRPDAVAALDQFEQQINWFAELPFEKQLQTADPSAIADTGGLHDKLLAVINQQRQKWAQAWSEGNSSGEAANRMMLLYRLAQTLADANEVARAGTKTETSEGGPEVLNGWPAWQLAPETLARPMADVVNRLKLATAAAVGGDDAGLAQQLERIDRDAPLAKLAGRLWRLLHEDLSALPASQAVAIMDQLIHPPTPDAWMLDHRRELADVCRYATEQEYARAAALKESADSINQFVNALADRLLVVLGDRRGKLPSIGGLGENDPRPPIKRK